SATEHITEDDESLDTPSTKSTKQEHK
ncbi:twin-arginine translocase TatA/TatE family subunit, partial [Staphylococcus pseudintermedius]|nr:twin-arginine translocase TatA/TatE family subunit [Staphylococcus pseudintermedius]